MIINKEFYKLFIFLYIFGFVSKFLFEIIKKCDFSTIYIIECYFISCYLVITITCLLLIL